MATPKAEEKKLPHRVLFTLKYKSGKKDARYIHPDKSKSDANWKKENITFEHLADAGYLKLRRKRYVTPLA